MIPRDRPAVQEITDITEPLPKWYGAGDRVTFIEEGAYSAALDYEDQLIILQRGDTAELMNLLYAREEQPGLWNAYFQKRKHR